jgi:predicted MFS family arabinose efflux permease
MAAPTIAHVRSALAGADLRKLLAIRLVGQGGDGFFQVALLASVLAPGDRSTLVDLFLTGLVTALPFTLLGPFVGVFIDRWPRRQILRFAPLIKGALLVFVLIPPTRSAAAFYLGALAVISVNRFQLSTAGAVVPRLTDAEDLLAANSVVTVGGSLANLVGVFIGGRIADVTGSPTVSIIIAGGCWLVTSWVASRISSDLSPMTIPESSELLRHQARRIVAELGDALRVLAKTPRAIGPITTFTVDQLGQGVILTLMLVVFRDEFREGIGSVSNVIGASGVGVMVGIATVGPLERRLRKEWVISLAFILAGVLLLAVAAYLRDWSLLTAGFFLGLTFAWKKVPTDTLVQEALPDGYRGRIFALFDVTYNAARILSGALALVMVPALGTRGAVVVVGLVFLAWSPVLPAWLRGRPEIELVAAADGVGIPIAVRWGGVEEAIEVLRSWDEDRDGARAHCLRVRLLDGSVVELHRIEPDGAWTLDRERDDPVPT